MVLQRITLCIGPLLFLVISRIFFHIFCHISNKRKQDLIFVGTQSNLLAYDVERNADSFFVEVQDGVNAMAVGRMTPSSKPIVLAGGNCSILGFDAKGMESFWTVTGDNVSSLALFDGVSLNPCTLTSTIHFYSQNGVNINSHSFTQ